MSLNMLQRQYLVRSVYLLFLPVFLLLLLLACGTAVTQIAHFACSTSLPPTITPIRTIPPGRPTPTPGRVSPSPTPYSSQAPTPFFVGDAVHIGTPGDVLYLRFRLHLVETRSAAPTSGGTPRSLHIWSLEIANLGHVPFETYPVAQMTITALRTNQGELNGTWPTSETALRLAGIEEANGASLSAPLQPGESRTYRLAVLTPAGTVSRLTFVLDTTTNNEITWLNQPNPYCSGG